MTDLYKSQSRKEQQLIIIKDITEHNSAIFAVINIGFIVLCLVHWDLYLLGLLCFFAVVTGLNHLFCKTLSIENSLIGLHVINVSAVLASQVVFGLTPVGLGFMLLGTMTSLWSSRSGKEFLFVGSIFLAGLFILYSFDFLNGIPTKIPMQQLGVVVLSGCVWGTARNLRRMRGILTSTKEELKKNRENLESEKVLLNARLEDLNFTTDQIKDQSEKLKVQLDRQRSLGVELRTKRKNERALVNAIHQDLQAPLRSIVSFTQLIIRSIKDTPQEKELTEYLEFAVDGGQRLSKMLNDLLDYAQHREPVESVEVDLNEILNSALSNLNNQIIRSGALVSVEKLPKIHGYPTQLIQLFQHLISNSIKFMRPEVQARIAISFQVPLENTNTISINFTDNGVGIADNQINKVFGLFNKFHNNQGLEGAGIGLSISRKIAIEHQGDLKVTSDIGAGSTFSVQLPCSVLISAPIDATQHNANTYQPVYE